MAWKQVGLLCVFFGDIIRRVETVVLVFPVAVTVLAAIVLVCGGQVSAWQWWFPVLGAFAWLLAWRGSQGWGRVGACGLFAMLLGGIWLWAGCVVEWGVGDNVFYHLPAIRALIEGWNPVYEATPEAFAQSLGGVDPWEGRLWHILFMPKGVWVFSAVAYHFTNTPTSLLLPLWPFLAMAAMGQVWRLLRVLPRWVRLGTVALLVAWAPTFNGLTDAAVCFGGMGLLAAMARQLSGERGVALPMVCLSFWMIVSKQVGVMACFVFWVCFSVALLWRMRSRAVPRLVVLGGVLMMLMALVCANPYLTSWQNYGHPFYPAYTVDEARFPAYDLTQDFKIGTADAFAMGHLGAFVNAYLSPKMVAFYYKWKLGQEEFKPSLYLWSLSNPEPGANAPLTFATRVGLLASFVIVALVGGRRFRFVWIGAFFALVCFPTPCLGFLRYVPWIVLLPALALALVFARLAQRKVRVVRIAAWMLFCMIVAGGVFKPMMMGAVSLEEAEAMRKVMKSELPPMLSHRIGGGKAKQWAKCYPESQPLLALAADSMTFGEESKICLLNLRLMTRQVAELNDKELYVISRAEAEKCPVAPSGEFLLPPDYKGLVETSWARNARLPNRIQRLLNYPVMVARAYCVVLPRSLWERIRAGIRDML